MSQDAVTIGEIKTQLKAKKLSATELAKHYLSNIKERDVKIEAYLTVCDKQALDQAKRIDHQIANGQDISPIAGVPLAIKDLFVTKGIQTTAGSKILKGYLPQYSATVVTRLAEAGMVGLGKVNLDEFAMGSSGEHSAYQVTKNPWDITRTPGGSSSGSAAAVAASECVAAIGTDTGGSIRLPASFCNVVGLKPTYGRVSRFGVIAMASSLDCPGVFAKTVEDCAMVFAAMAGHDRNDATSSKMPVNHFDPTTASVKNLKIGIPKEYFIKGLDPKVETLIKDAIAVYEKAGAKIVDVSLPHTEHALPTYYVICPAEVSSNMSRYDGVRYALSEQAESLIQTYFKTRDVGFGAEVKRRIMIGTYVLSAGYYDAYYLKAQKIRTLIKKDFDDAFQSVDVILAPTSPTTAFKIGEKLADPLAMYLSDVLTVPINLAGVPAMSIPCGFVDGLPVGMQLIGKHFDEATLFSVGQLYQQVTDWHKKVPPMVENN